MLKKFIEYVRSRFLYIVLNLIVILLVVYVHLLQIISIELTMLITLIITIVVLINIITSFISICKTEKELIKYSQAIDEKFLITKLIDKPDYQTNVYIKIINQILTDEHQKTIEAQENLNEYKEQTIKWIHKSKQHINILENSIDKSDFDSLQALTLLKSSIDSLLFVQKLDTFSQSAVLTKHNLYELITEIIVKNRYILKDLKITLDIDEKYIVLTDKYFFKEAIEQLISNTVKYHASCLTIILKNDKLIYNNDSKPIPDTEKKYLFLKGVTSSRIDNATGYGLYYCKKSLNLLGMDIRIVNNSQCVTFEIDLV